MMPPWSFLSSVNPFRLDKFLEWEANQDASKQIIDM
jgi:hypothetical protein